MEKKNWMKLEFPSKSINVSFARTAIALFASQLDFTLEELEDIKVAISEATSNCVIHGYGGDNSGNVIVEANYGEDNQLHIFVIDYGKGIANISQAIEAGYTTVPEERMGLGLAFIHEYMTDVKISSEEGKGTTIRMTKNPATAEV